MKTLYHSVIIRGILLALIADIYIYQSIDPTTWAQHERASSVIAGLVIAILLKLFKNHRLSEMHMGIRL